VKAGFPQETGLFHGNKVTSQALERLTGSLRQKADTMENMNIDTTHTTRAAPKKYAYMRMLESLFAKPGNLISAASLTLKQKKFLLKKWYEEREEYIVDHYKLTGDEKDAEMKRLVEAMNEIKNNHMRYN
jgi:hypothetical protein